MNIKDVRKLRKDDEVYWNDPDKGLCSKTIKIATIEVRLPCYTVIITDVNGDTLECFASELS